MEKTGFCPSTSDLPSQYHSIIAAHSSSSTCFSYQNDKRTKSGNLSKKKIVFLSDTGKHWLEMDFHFVQCFKCIRVRLTSGVAGVVFTYTGRRFVIRGRR
jgi:hypothetical protein